MSSSVDLSGLKVIQQCGTIGNDALTRPILVFAAANLPDPKVVSYDVLLNYLTSQLDLVVESDYVVVLFYHGMVHRPSWSWLKETYSVLTRKYKKNLKNLYIVHPTMWHRFFMGIINAIISSKFLDKVIYVHSLSQLGEYVPLNHLYIPDIVREYDANKFGPLDMGISKQNIHEKSVFGAPLKKLMIDGTLPFVLVQIVEHIESEGLETVGIFRRSPSHQVLHDVIKKFNEGESVDLKEYDIHLAAVLLKSFLRELPESIIPSSVQEKLYSLKNGSNKEAIQMSQEVIDLLADENKLVLAYIIKLLKKVSLKSEQNLMTAQNLSIIFGPNIMPSDLVFNNLSSANHFLEILINNDEIFFEGILNKYEASKVEGKGKEKAPLEGSSVINKLNEQVQVETLEFEEKNEEQTQEKKEEGKIEEEERKEEKEEKEKIQEKEEEAKVEEKKEIESLVEREKVEVKEQIEEKKEEEEKEGKEEEDNETEIKFDEKEIQAANEIFEKVFQEALAEAEHYILNHGHEEHATIQEFEEQTEVKLEGMEEQNNEQKDENENENENEGQDEKEEEETKTSSVQGGGKKKNKKKNKNKK